MESFLDSRRAQYEICLLAQAPLTRSQGVTKADKMFRK
jgi:hypothetical protein